MKASESTAQEATRTAWLPLHAVRVEGAARARCKLDATALNAYAEAYSSGHTMQPVVVFYDGEHYWLADGFHRHEALRLHDHAEVEAEVRSGSMRDAILFSCGANATHGLPRSRDDKELVVRKLLADNEWKDWSDRDIATACAVSHTFVGKVRKTVTGSASSDRTYRTKHGRVAVMNTTNIGKRNLRVAAAGAAPVVITTSPGAERASVVQHPLVVRAQTMQDGTNVALIDVPELRRLLGARTDGKLRIALDFQPGIGACAQLSWLAAADVDACEVGGTEP